MSTSPEAIRSYYAQHGPVSEPHQLRTVYSDLPADITALRDVVQGNMLHIYWAERYGQKPDSERNAMVNARSIPQKIEYMQSVHEASLTEARLLDQRMIGNCRDFSLLIVSMLREKSIPARARCGFATYFMPDHYEDHWVCEYWNADQKRWILVDAQLDAFQQETLKVDFDVMDVPRDRFIIAGAAWQMCRQGKADPESFGIFDMHGYGFIRGNLVRDAMSLRKIELLPWDWWAGMTRDDESAIVDSVDLMDELAGYTLTPEVCFDALRTFAEKHLPAEADWQPDQAPVWSPSF